MISIRKSTLLFLVTIATLTSCDKLFEEEEGEDPSDCATMTAPVITVNSTTIQSGSSLQFTLARVDAGSSYFWKGPNGFSSTTPNLEIPQVLTNHAGRYTVEEVTAWGCRRSKTTDSIIVTIPAAPCNPTANTASIAGASNMSFYYTGGHTSGGSYFLEGNSSTGDLELEFPGTSRPVPGVYTIRPLGGDWNVGDVRVRLVSQSSNWPASSGKVYLTTVAGNKLKAIFCSAPVYGQTFGFSSTATANIIEQ